MPNQITLADVDQAEAALAEAKSSEDAAARQEAADNCVATRLAFRAQEEAAGRRGGLVSIQED